MANCLRNLPDDLAEPERGNLDNLAKALARYREAADIFSELGDEQKRAIVAEMIAEIESELAAATSVPAQAIGLQ